MRRVAPLLLALSIGCSASEPTPSVGGDAHADSAVLDAASDAPAPLEAEVDASDAAETSDAKEWCNGPAPAPDGDGGGEGDECSATKPCGAPYQCYFDEGCTAPKGTCHRWALCPDAAILEHFCGCDGAWRNDRHAPWTEPSHCATDAGTD